VVKKEKGYRKKKSKNVDGDREVKMCERKSKGNAKIKR